MIMSATHMCPGQKPNDSQPRPGTRNSEKCPTPSIQTHFNNSIVHCIPHRFFNQPRLTLHKTRAGIKLVLTSTMQMEKKKSEKLFLLKQSVIHTCVSPKEALTRASAREGSAAISLPVPVCMRDRRSHFCNALINIHRADSMQMRAFSCELRGRRQSDTV